MNAAAPYVSPQLVMRHSLRRDSGARRALSDDEIRRVAPSVFAQQPWGRMKERYLFVPTSGIVAAMRAEGYQVVQAMQGRCRTEGKAEFTRHLLRFALPQGEQVRGSVPELVLINSHDGTSAYRLLLGVFRMVCRNGLLVASEVAADLKFRHARSLQDQIIEGTGTLVRELPRVNDQIERLGALRLQDDERRAFAAGAHHLRWGGVHAPVQPADLLTTRRQEDRQADAWTTLNVVQENLLRGGLAGRTSTNRPTTTRQVRAINENVRLNEALAVMANELARARTVH